MTPAHYARLKQLFYEIVDLDPSGRADHLAQLSAEDPDSAVELRTLLAELDRTGPFLEPPSVSAQASLPERVGNYRVERELGAGGSGRVFLVVRSDDEFRHPVALKLLYPRATDRDFGSRLRLERRALAQLNHPNIAHLVDWGETTEGVPFLAMEYVDGTPIAQYCRERECDNAGKLRIFLQVCGAVEHAHRNLIVHRDLKPGNILVKQDGTVKLLDFGIAKLLSAEESTTITSAACLTPAYASPEQVRGDAITTATDVYSLGVVLYELLTGSLPYLLSTHTSGEVAHAVLEQEPQRPKLAADLGDIVLKALRKEPERRYASVEQMSDDVRLYLDGRPVRASAGSRMYIFTRFIRRNRAAVTLGTLAVCALIASGILIAWKWRAAEQNLGMAEIRYAALRGFAHSILSTLNQPSSPGQTEAQRLIANVTVGYLDQLGRERMPDDELQMDIAAAYAALGDAEGQAFNPNRGDTGAAMANYRKSHDILLAEWRTHPDAAHVEQLLWSFTRVGDLMGDASAAADFLSDGTSIAAKYPADFAIFNPSAIVFESRGKRLWRSGDLAGAIASFRKALDFAGQALQQRPNDPKSLQTAAAENGLLCRVHTLMGKLDDALSEGAEAERIGEKLLSVKRTEKTRRDTAINALFLCKAQRKQGNLLQASAGIGGTLGELRSIAVEDGANAQAKWDLAAAYLEQGEISAAQRLPDEALASFREAVRLSEALSAKDPLNHNGSRAYGEILIHLGRLQLASPIRTAQAAFTFQKAIVVCTQARQAAPSDAYVIANLARAYRGKAGIEASTDRAGAIRDLKRSVDLWSDAYTRCPLDPELRADAGEAAQKLAQWSK